MKRLSKIALLAAASAFMLAVFPACGGEDEPEPKAPEVKATATLDKAISLEAEGTDSFTVTIALDGDTVKDELGDDKNGLVELTDNTSKITISAVAFSSVNDDKKSLVYTFTATAKADATAGDGTITARVKAAALNGGADLTCTIAYKIEGGKDDQSGTPIEPVNWKISDYLSTLGSIDGTAQKLTDLGYADGAECGIATLGSNVKVRSDGKGVSNTVTDGVTGYCQLSNGKAGSLLLTVPAGTAKITLGAKNTNGALAIYDSSYTTALKAFTETPSDYADFVYEHTFTEETQVYVTSPGGKTTNFKSLKLE